VTFQTRKRAAHSTAQYQASTGAVEAATTARLQILIEVYVHPQK